MTIKKLTETEKTFVVSAYYEGHPQKRIAEILGTSARTVGRVLETQGILTPAKQQKEETKALLKLINSHKVTLSELEQLLKNKEGGSTYDASSIQRYLNNCSTSQLAKFFYNSGLVKVAKIFEREKQKERETHEEHL